jgi:hypothetical protein
LCIDIVGHRVTAYVIITGTIAHLNAILGNPNAGVAFPVTVLPVTVTVRSSPLNAMPFFW